MLLADLVYQDLEALGLTEELPKPQVEAAAAVLSRLNTYSQGFEVAVGNIVSSLSSGSPANYNAIRTATDRVIGKLMSVGSQTRSERFAINLISSGSSSF